ncbi:hypothetical protein L7H23_07790 [Sphingopyxis sp. BSN-002]|uniref:hypothetical protein n=1 Tax=Sphingopyxis sp. BSN-002 TaxID=2911495 RepID=UPI001EDA98D8|nr:hypothetical protein [Sphingopyxis sp. BSN-002]UKK85993.1 hypothetical protein L7H23_07790 [Sphingopyxis sp. BSN-002]
MAGTQAPRGFALIFAIVGIPLIIWNAADASGELGALDASSSTEAARIDYCVAKAAEFEPEMPAPRRTCECIVAKAAAQGALKDYGAYDETKLESIIGECTRGG